MYFDHFITTLKLVPSYQVTFPSVMRLSCVALSVAGVNLGPVLINVPNSVPPESRLGVLALALKSTLSIFELNSDFPSLVETPIWSSTRAVTSAFGAGLGSGFVSMLGFALPDNPNWHLTYYLKIWLKLHIAKMDKFWTGIYFVFLTKDLLLPWKNNHTLRRMEIRILTYLFFSFINYIMTVYKYHHQYFHHVIS